MKQKLSISLLFISLVFTGCGGGGGGDATTTSTSDTISKEENTVVLKDNSEILTFQSLEGSQSLPTEDL